MGTMIKFAQATRNLEDSLIREPINKHNDLMTAEEVISRSYSYGNLVAYLVTIVVLAMISK